MDFKEYIDNIDIFKEINKEAWKALTERASIVKLKKGENLFMEKTEVTNIYIVAEGNVVLYRLSEGGQKKIVYILGKNYVINEVIMDGKFASISADAYGASLILSIPREDFLKAMSIDWNFNYKIICSMSKKIRRLYRQLKNTVPLKIERRVAAKLWKLSKDYGKTVKEGEEISLNITVNDIAEMLGSSRETISRAIKELKENDLIINEKRKIIIKDRKKLAEFFKR
ncbi:Crp/Fnr family transcriptional regulator [Clostridium peptidivorans]|uniref:Crp/Fnr family transcriptional regulator n=1 Tax=Clostridium peptidivorans TaxID=100174 RepID=UPI000BE377FD|nr:Crp/Fnr family transcriptional regulator [Clostridium peptidivorans]